MGKLDRAKPAKRPVIRSTTASRREDRRDSVRYLHVACMAYMVQNPLHKPDHPLPPAQQFLPHVEKGTTYNVGRNKAKRERRAASLKFRAWVRAQASA